MAPPGLHHTERASSSKTRNVDHEHDAFATSTLTSCRCHRQRTRACDGQSHTGATTRLILMDLPLYPSSCCLWKITEVDCIDVLALFVVLVPPALVLPHPFQSSSCILFDAWIVLIGENNDVGALLVFRPWVRPPTAIAGQQPLLSSCLTGARLSRTSSPWGVPSEHRLGLAGQGQCLV